MQPDPVSHSHPTGLFNLFSPHNSQATPSPTAIKIRLPPMGRNLRSSSAVQNRSSSQPSGSEYHASDDHMDMDQEEVMDDEAKVENDAAYALSSRGRRVAKKSYMEVDTEEDPDAEGEPDENPLGTVAQGAHDDAQVDDDDGSQPRYPLRHKRPNRSGNLRGVIESDDDNEVGVSKRGRSKKTSGPPTSTNGRVTRQKSRLSHSRPTSSRRTRKIAQAGDDEDGYVDEPSSGTGDADVSFDNVHTSPDPEDLDADAEGELEEPEQDGRPYALRTRAPINYAIPPPLEATKERPSKKSGGGRTNGRYGHGKPKGLGWSATGAQLGQWMGLAGDDSDSDNVTRSPKKPFGVGSGIFAGSAGTTGMLPADLTTTGGPSNLGKVGDTSLADADPLGVNQNVTFDEIGGLDDHITALKEMTLLPLLYPEVFQRFNLTPPRGVLFHGPPGTGKTLLARALAASSRANGKGVSFFMRKGADCLSKWVGEAERQLRLLFEEARNCQPSIIFFDEIDGLAPVRSSKQDQIHASIVSTLLALMDGMDGRGQVVVIGATNRPDAVDPALRRPGRFDREFYFPLPGIDARERILKIMTHKWAGWEDQNGEESVRRLAKLTKGYAGADLRALCTEAALNAVQRRYPQIYKSTERLLLSPETINVQLRDFLFSVKKLVPSSARSASSAASPLPSQLAPLLSSALETAKNVVAKVMPVSKKRTALEEAEWEDEGEDGAFDRETLLQSMETLRVYRPRVLLHGPAGMGQGYVANAVLHHLEGYHTQSLDLGTLMNDSTRTVEAAIVQLFIEAKRHQPSVVYIPSLLGWCAAVTETSRSTVRAMLETLAPTDPVLLLAVVDGPVASLPRDVRAWFGPTRENRVEVTKPGVQQRQEFFEPLLQDVTRPPNQFPDGVKRKKRILEELPIAPPVQPRQLTEAELAAQDDNDQKVITLLKYRLGPILTELKRKFKRFTKRAADEYNLYGDGDAQPVEPAPEPVPTPQVESVTHTHVVEIQTGPNEVTEIVNEQQTETLQTDGNLLVTPTHPEVQETALPVAPLPPPPESKPHIYEMDLEKVHIELYRSKYLTPDNFLNDIRKIAHNASVYADKDPDRLFKAQALLTAAEVSILDFDQQFRLECERMAIRERRRREDRRKARSLDKTNQENDASDSANAYAPGTRRSARHNGQQPEITITDPLQLERRLKRQRSTDGGTDRPSPSEEVGEGRTPKRSRVNSDADDNDPLLKANVVRFAEAEQQPSGMNAYTYLVSNNVNSTPRKAGGFDPALLNPLPSPQDPLLSIDQTSLVNGISSPSVAFAAPIMPIFQAGSPNPFLSFPNGPHEIPDEPSTDPREQEPATETSAPLPQIVENTDQHLPKPLPENMEIERTPTPLPDFRIDEVQLVQLKETLCSQTHSLSIEELEQLRATCLGAVWKHRTDWNRDELIKELLEIVAEFVEEVSIDSMSLSP